MRELFDFTFLSLITKADLSQKSLLLKTLKGGA
jgi:hypothetical protein